MGCSSATKLGNQPVAITLKQNQGEVLAQARPADSGNLENAEIEDNDAKLEQLIAELHM